MAITLMEQEGTTALTLSCACATLMATREGGRVAYCNTYAEEEHKQHLSLDIASRPTIIAPSSPFSSFTHPAHIC